MNDINTVTMTGNLTADPELKYSQSGYPVLSFSIANNQRKKSGDQWVEEAHFFDMTIFGKRGESLSSILRKGLKVCIQCKARQDRWQDQQSQQNRTKVAFVVDELVILSDRNSGPSSGPQGSGYPSAGYQPQGQPQGQPQQYQQNQAPPAGPPMEPPTW